MLISLQGIFLQKIMRPFKI
uniref:Uncharacterized protein n=1 Tax=Arundo donax TaxID=35708 RepID=A0A0A9EAF1_ARUDO